MGGGGWTQGILRKKMLKINDQSHYMYENKGNIDTMPDEKSDIYVDMTCFLQFVTDKMRKNAAHNTTSARTLSGNFFMNSVPRPTGSPASGRGLLALLHPSIQRAFATMSMKKQLLGDFKGFRIKMEVIEYKLLRPNVGDRSEKRGTPPFFRTNRECY
jgi:hypothetical protein